jgi:ferredoxin-NADP reductase/predicted pyridoxine 5'-phosphate oxidase superfamily flavin-nucleotide-binding protein
MSFSLGMSFNHGEEQMHELLHVPDRDNPTSTMLTAQASFMLQRAPLLAIGTLDDRSRPWTSLWGGQTGFSQPLGGGIIGTRTIVDGVNDPVVQALVGGVEKGEMVQDDTKMFSGLTIDLMTRKRVKIFGHMVAGSVSDVDVEFTEGEERPEGAPDKQDQIQLVTKIEQSLGNCPKYLNQYEIRPALVTSKVVSQGKELSKDAQDLISKLDMFFLSSSTPEDMDTNHRGGPPGFVRILSSTEIVYPEYSGNRLYQTLGNLQMNPKVGITFPDYSTGDILYITGTAEVLVASAAASLLPGSNLALKITVEEARHVESGLPFRGTRKVASPYNPLVRKLATEGNIKSALSDSSSHKSATLLKTTAITSSISRFTFSVPEGVEYKPGQWVALDFSKDMDYGYSHMQDDDPQSLNDDYVRTFTISSTPSPEGKDKEFDITIRRVGPVTSYLFKQNPRAGFEVPILGIGGEFEIEQEKGTVTPFVAGGVGITPLLGHLGNLKLEPETLKLFWTLRLADVEFAVEILRQHPDLAKCTEIFLTGTDASHDVEEKMQALKDIGTKIEMRRIQKSDLDAVDSGIWYLCAGKVLRTETLHWLDGKKVIFEDFDY